jgi:uncharacterized protein (DUF1800 family)
MLVSNRLKNQHLLWRAAFGPMAENTAELDRVSQKELWELLVKTSSKKPEYLDVASDAIKGVVMGIQDAAKMETLTKEQKLELRRQSREDLRSLNLRWLDEMINSEAQLREKMAFFWHGHFACRDINIFFQQLMLHEIRSNALGNFGDLLKAVSKSASMLGFLNNQQNKKKHPNENFAREVMELFTLGRGNYTENDIKEAARAFTGWGFNIQGEFVFRKNLHDSDSKTIFGKTGNFDGDDVLRMLLENKQTAKNITKKLYRFFVNEQAADENRINWLADRFYQGNYNILSMLQDIFTSDWFYAEKNIGNKIKSPVEFITGIRRILPMELQVNQVQLLFQKVLGQVLFYPPNVAGWPGGKNWIDSSSLMFRLRIPQLMKDNETVNISGKTDDDQQMGMMDGDMQMSKKDRKIIGGKQAQGSGQRIVADINWEEYMKVYKEIPRENLADVMATILLQTPDGAVQKTTLEAVADAGSKEAYIKSVTVALMATPEYQLC